MAEIKSLLDGVIAEDIENVQSLESGSDERSTVITELVQLHKLRIEEIKAQTDAEEKYERRKMDNDIHERERMADECQVKDQMIDRFLKTGVAVAELVLPLVCYGVWMSMGFQFEETGAFTSTTFKNLLNRFKPTKRG